MECVPTIQVSDTIKNLHYPTLEIIPNLLIKSNPETSSGTMTMCIRTRDYSTNEDNGSEIKQKKQRKKSYIALCIKHTVLMWMVYDRINPDSMIQIKDVDEHTIAQPLPKTFFQFFLKL